MRIIITENQLKGIKESIKSGHIECSECGWEWKLSEGGKDPYVCHKCGHDNETIKEIEKDDTAKWIKCKNCKKLFTQTIHKKKKSLPICPWCGTHN